MSKENMDNSNNNLNLKKNWLAGALKTSTVAIFAFWLGFAYTYSTVNEKLLSLHKRLDAQEKEIGLLNVKYMALHDILWDTLTDMDKHNGVLKNDPRT